uniref:VP2 n=1 Tax=Gierle tick virus TaxID=2867436 RepID=A0A8G0QFE2_9REOV|nr:VP2 [Gierle tick virus]
MSSHKNKKDKRNQEKGAQFTTDGEKEKDPNVNAPEVEKNVENENDEGKKRREKMAKVGALMSSIASQMREGPEGLTAGRLPEDNLDELLNVLQSYSDVAKIAPSASVALEPNDVVKTVIEEHETSIKPGPNTLAAIDSLPHFYQLAVEKIGPRSGLGAHVAGTHAADTYPFSLPMRDAFGFGFDYSYVRIKTQNFGFELYVDPLCMEEVHCKIGSKEALGVGLTNQNCAPEIKYNDVKNPSEMMRFIIFLIAGAARAGRWIYIGHGPDGEEKLFTEKCWNKVPGIEAYRRIHGWLPKDNYEDYPHVPEALVEYNQYRWFQQEVNQAMTNNGLGTIVDVGDNGPVIEADFNRKLGEPAMANVDFVCAECHANVMDDLYNEKMNVDEYVRFLQMCQIHRHDIVGDRLQVILKTYYRQTLSREVEMSWLLTFPNDDVYWHTYKQAFMVSPNFRNHVLSTLLAEIKSRISVIEFVSIPEATASFERRENTRTANTRGMPVLLDEWRSLSVASNPAHVAERIVFDICSPFTNVCSQFESYGHPTPSKLLFCLLGAKVAMLMNPNLYDTNLHVKARLFSAILSTFFAQEYATLLARRGYGIDVRGNVRQFADSAEATRFDNDIAVFTILEHIPEIGDARQARWNNFRDIQQWLLRNELVYVREVGGIRYYRYQRRIRVPGRAYVPVRQVGGGILPVFGHLIEAIPHVETYRRRCLGPDAEAEVPYDRLALNILINRITAYIQSFSEWFHWVYCPLYLQIALHPLIWWSHDLDPARWRSYHCIRENPDLIAENGLHGAPFGRPVPCLFNHKDIHPVTGREGLDILTRIHAEGNMYRGGGEDENVVIEISRYHALWQANDSERMVEAHVRALYSGRELMEGLKLICELSLGTLLQNVDVHDYIRNAFIAGRLPSRTYWEILDLYGIRIDDKAFAQMPGGFLQERVNGDYRCYFPQIGRYDPGADFVPEVVGRIDPVRQSVRRNVEILLQAVFNQRYGMIKFRTGMTLSLAPRNDLLFSSTHALFNFYCRINTDVTSDYEPDTGRFVRYFNAIVGWRANDGRDAHVQLRVKSIHDLLTGLAPFVGGSVDGVTFVVPDTRRVNPEVHAFMTEAVRQRVAVILFPHVRGILHHTITSVLSVTALFRDYELETYELLQGMAPTSMVRMNVVETIHVRGGTITGNVVKPLLPVNPGGDEWVFCTDVNVVDRRVKGIPIRINEFFPQIVFHAGGRPWVEVNDEHQRGYPLFPYGLRSIIFVRHMSPMFRPEIVVQMS